MILHAHMEVRGLTAQTLFQVALSIAQDLISSGHPRQAQAAVLERLQEAGFGAAYLRLEGGALQWEYDPAYLCPAAMKTLTQSPQAVPVPLIPMQLSTAPLLKGVLDSAQPRFVESDEWIPPDTPQDVRRSALQVAHILEITCGILSPVIHDGRALGLLVVWGHELTRDDLPAAEQLGRLLGAALSHPAFQAAAGQAATQDRDALLALQSVISTLSIDQPLEQSLRVVRDALPRLLPEMLAPVFVLRDWERNEWNWQPLIPDWAESTVHKHLGRIADRLVPRVGESGLWKTLSQGGLVCTTDSAELLGHAMPPRMARTIQKVLGIRWFTLFPIAAGGRVLGLMLACSRNERWPEGEMELLTTYATQVGLALHNAYLYEAQRRRVERLRALMDAADGILLPRSRSQYHGAIVSTAVRLLDADAGVLFREDPESNELRVLASEAVSHRYLRAVQENYRDMPIRSSLEMGLPLRVSDMRGDPVTKAIHSAVAEEGICCMLGLPLLAQGKLRGFLVLYRKRPVPFSEEAALVGHAFALLGTLEFETARLMEESERQLAEVEALRQVLHELAVQRDLQPTARLILEHALRLTQSDGGALFLWDPAREVLAQQIGLYHGEVNARELLIKPNEGFAGTVFVKGASISVEDYFSSGQARKEALMDPANRTAAAVVPIRRMDETIGVLVAVREHPKPPYTSEDVDLLEALAEESAVAIANAQLAQERDREREFTQRVLDSILFRLGGGRPVRDYHPCEPVPAPAHGLDAGGTHWLPVGGDVHPGCLASARARDHPAAARPDRRKPLLQPYSDQRWARTLC